MSSPIKFAVKNFAHGTNLARPMRLKSSSFLFVFQILLKEDTSHTRQSRSTPQFRKYKSYCRMSWRRNFSTTPSVVIFRYYSVFSSRLHSTGSQLTNSVQRHLWSSSRHYSVFSSRLHSTGSQHANSV